MANSISADQVAAPEFGRHTRFSSIQLDTSDGSGSGHGPGLSLAWDQRGKPVSGFSDPVQLFHKLFSADELPLEQRQAAIAKNRSVLDAIFTEAKRVQRGLTKTDNDKIDEYFQGIRDIETRLNKDEDWLDVPKAESPMDEPKLGLKARRNQGDVRPHGRRYANRQHTRHDLPYAGAVALNEHGDQPHRPQCKSLFPG